MRVVADTGPLHYLVLVGQIDLLPRLFRTVTVPTAVRAELRHPAAPQPVRAWAGIPPPWLVVSPAPAENDPALLRLDSGERAVIALAIAAKADLVVMDDRAGVAVARAKGFAVTGTLGILDLAARRGLLDLADALGRLKATNFRYRPELLDAVLAQHRARGGR